MRGKARYIAASVALFWDHPRVCGEKKKMNMRKDKRMGSPPRMRGKADYTPVVDVRVRITPAYAGKSDNFVAALSDFGDHPRVCGEKCSATGSGLAVSGSPPRMRGKVPVVSSVSVQFGITPAYAGKSVSLNVLTPVFRDHPRVCGEKPTVPAVGTVFAGSPPRMRGKDFSHLGDVGQNRITPAYAGKRLKRSHSIGHFSCILCLFHSVLHRASVSDGSRAGPCAPPCLPAQNAVPV